MLFAVTRMLGYLKNISTLAPYLALRFLTSSGVNRGDT